MISARALLVVSSAVFFTACGAADEDRNTETSQSTDATNSSVAPTGGDGANGMSSNAMSHTNHDASPVGNIEPGNMEPGDFEPGNFEPGNFEPGNTDPGNYATGNNASSNNTATGDNAAMGDASEPGMMGEEPGEPEDVVPMPGQLTAGEWSDHDNWEFWLGLVQPDGPTSVDWSHYIEAWGFYPYKRVLVSVSDANDVAVDVPVKAIANDGTVLWEARTNNDGEAILYPSMFDEQAPTGLTIEVDGAPAQTIDAPYDDAGYTFTLTSPAPASNALDVMFVVDVTGSMHDELDYLKSEMASILDEVSMQRPNLAIRASFNFYCDPAEWKVRSSPFADVPTALEDLSKAPECGGGDTPEAVDEGLEDALEDHQWSASARARIIFLVLDAPPHTDGTGQQRLRDMTALAAKEGVQIIPVMSSGAGKDLEFLLRTLAIATHAPFTFLTDHSGIGGSHIEPTIGNYKVEYLNTLITRIILRSTEL